MIMNQMKYFALRHKLQFFRKLIEFEVVFVWVWVAVHSYWGTFTIVQLSERLIEMQTYRSGREMICFGFHALHEGERPGDLARIVALSVAECSDLLVSHATQNWKPRNSNQSPEVYLTGCIKISWFFFKKILSACFLH